ncbi:MAG: hypothetical protein ACK4KW_01560 [Gemmobacter sp.]
MLRDPVEGAPNAVRAGRGPAVASGVSMVPALPWAIIGPGFPRGTAATDIIAATMPGGWRTGVPNSTLLLVDVRDVVTGHTPPPDPTTGDGS